MSFRRLVCGVLCSLLALAAAGGVAAQAAHVLFPADNYAPPSAGRAPPGLEVPPLQAPAKPEPVVSAAALPAGQSDRCFAQCQTAFASCQQQPHDWSDCAVRAGRQDCGTLQDPAKRKACYAQVQDCHARGATDTCQANQRQCLGACGN